MGIHENRKAYPRYMASRFEGGITNHRVSGKGNYIPIVFSPSNLSDTVAASFSQTAIPGGSAPVVTYSSTGARQLSLSLDIPLDYLPPNSEYNNTEEYLNAFRALVYPSYGGNGAVYAPYCTVSLTNITLTGACTNVSIDYKTDRFSEQGEMAASVSLSFIEVLDKALGAIHIAQKPTGLKNMRTTNVVVPTIVTREVPSRTTLGEQMTLNGAKEVSYVSGTGYSQIGDTNRNEYTVIDPGVNNKNSEVSVVTYFVQTSKWDDLELWIPGNLSINADGTLRNEKIPNVVTYRNQQPQFTFEGEKQYLIIIYVPYKNLTGYDTANSVIRYITVNR